MPPPANLQQAANQAYDNMYVQWNTGQLKSRLTSFASQCSPFFKEGNPNDRTVGNWLIPIQALAANMSAGVTPLSLFNDAVQYIYRMCWQADAMQTAGLISATQANAVLVNYITYFV